MVGIRSREPVRSPTDVTDDARPKRAIFVAGRRTPDLITGPVLSAAMDLDERPLIAASGLGVVLGIAAVIGGTTLMATGGVILIVLSVISSLLAVGIYFEEPESAEPG